LGLIAIAGVLTYRSVSLSANFSAAVSFVGIVCLAVIGVAIIAQGGANGDSVTLEPFTTGGVPFSTVAFGVAFAFVGFAGFESAAVLGEEADNPTRAIPRAIIMGLVISGVVVTFSTYVQVIGFPDVTSLITDVSPLQTLSAEYVGGSVTGKILTAAGLLSSFGALVSSINATGRMIFSFARDGIVPQKLAYTHPRHGTPVAAFAVVLVISAVATLCFMGSTPIEVFTDLSHTGSVAILVTYLMTIVAAMVRFRSPVTMSILAVGVPAIAYVLYRQLWPVAAYPAKFFIWAGVAWVLLVVIWVLVSPPLRARLATAETLELYENPGEAHVGRATDAPTESPV
jgi:amino acid transporter